MVNSRASPSVPQEVNLSNTMLNSTNRTQHSEVTFIDFEDEDDFFSDDEDDEFTREKDYARYCCSKKEDPVNELHQSLTLLSIGASSLPKYQLGDPKMHASMMSLMSTALMSTSTSEIPPSLPRRQATNHNTGFRDTTRNRKSLQTLSSSPGDDDDDDDDDADEFFHDESSYQLPSVTRRVLSVVPPSLPRRQSTSDSNKLLFGSSHHSSSSSLGEDEIFTKSNQAIAARHRLSALSPPSQPCRQVSNHSNYIVDELSFTAPSRAETKYEDNKLDKCACPRLNLMSRTRSNGDVDSYPEKTLNDYELP